MRLEMFFDFSCPFAYIASTQIEGIARHHGADLSWKPMLLGGVFRDTGAGDGPMTSMAPAKARHNAADMHRWADVYGVPFRLPDGHPRRTVRALRALLALPEDQWPAAIHALYRAYWVEGADVAEPAVIRDALASAGVAPDAIERALAANDDPAIKDELKRRTTEAVERGVFGAPSIFVSGGERDPIWYWGQDRLHMIDAALAGWRPGDESAPPTRALMPAITRDGRTRTIEFWYDFSSPYSYLGATQIETLVERAGAELRWRPMLLGAVFQGLGTDNVPLFQMVQAKRDYLAREMNDWAAYHGVPFSWPSRFPMRTIAPLRLALQAGDRIAELSRSIYRAYWAEDRDISDEATLREILEAGDFDADAMLAGTKDPAVKQQLIDNTSEATRRGIFGAPTFIVDPGSDGGDLLFWGQDRLPLVERALFGWHPAGE